MIRMLCGASIFTTDDFVHLYQSGAMKSQFYPPTPLMEECSFNHANAVMVPNAVRCDDILPALWGHIVYPAPIMPVNLRV